MHNSPTNDRIIENLFASPPLGLDKLFDDPIVRKRIGEIIGLAGLIHSVWNLS